MIIEVDSNQFQSRPLTPLQKSRSKPQIRNRNEQYALVRAHVCWINHRHSGIRQAGRQTPGENDITNYDVVICQTKTRQFHFATRCASTDGYSVVRCVDKWPHCLRLSCVFICEWICCLRDTDSVAHSQCLFAIWTSNGVRSTPCSRGECHEQQHRKIKSIFNFHNSSARLHPLQHTIRICSTNIEEIFFRLSARGCEGRGVASNSIVPKCWDGSDVRVAERRHGGCGDDVGAKKSTQTKSREKRSAFSFMFMLLSVCRSDEHWYLYRTEPETMRHCRNKNEHRIVMPDDSEANGELLLLPLLSVLRATKRSKIPKMGNIVSVLASAASSSVGKSLVHCSAAAYYSHWQTRGVLWSSIIIAVKEYLLGRLLFSKRKEWFHRRIRHSDRSTDASKSSIFIRRVLLQLRWDRSSSFYYVVLYIECCRHSTKRIGITILAQGKLLRRKQNHERPYKVLRVLQSYTQDDDGVSCMA